MITSFDMLFYTLSFAVPGFIIYYMKSKFSPQRQENTTNYIFRYLFYSSFNYAICSPVIYWLFKSNYYINHIYKTAAIWGAIIFIIPLILGGLSGIAEQKDWNKILLNKLGINPIHRVPTAWDYKFSSIDKCAWVLVTTKDDKRIMGYFAGNSFASSDASERDIYLEKLYVRNETNDGWIEDGINNGVLIKADQIKYIEFL